MRRSLSLLLALLAAFGPLARPAGAACTSLGNCSIDLRPELIDVGFARWAAIAAFSAAALGTTVWRLSLEAREPRPMPSGVYVFTDADGVERLALSIVPPPQSYFPQSLPAGGDETAPRPATTGFRVNDPATVTTLAITGAALATGVLAGLLGSKH